ncbi:CU044_2847 family protein [Streptomyces sp. CBMA123]|uniref:CU044_2847 family protein n=1 Tax=Streptomyces sp. CBMA123 TaxID=1896313 RepID=UPI00294FFD62|nr:CU044_2847 family protein [Streptomyces sp. CBMA123]
MELPVDVDGGAQNVVRVEVSPVGEDGLVRVARPGQVMARATRSLGEMVTGIRPVAQSFVDGFRGMAHAPDELNLEFGLSLSAEADVIISSTAAQANFKVSLTWHRPPEEPTVPIAPTEPTAPTVPTAPTEPAEVEQAEPTA